MNENIPKKFLELAEKMITDEEIKFGKIKYNDKVFHQSKILKLYVENENNKKYKKDRQDSKKLAKIESIFILLKILL